MLIQKVENVIIVLQQIIRYYAGALFFLPCFRQLQIKLTLYWEISYIIGLVVAPGVKKRQYKPVVKYRNECTKGTLAGNEHCSTWTGTCGHVEPNLTVPTHQLAR